MTDPKKDQLSVGWIQMDIAWHQPRRNQETVDHFANVFPPELDVLFLPEMFTTGFTMEPDSCAQKMDGATVRWMQDFAAAHSILLAGSVVIRDRGHFANRLLFVYPEGHIRYYDKRHLFNHAGEGAHYQAGQVREVFTYKGWRIMPQVCYDLRFPVWSRNDLNYDLLVYVANWPTPRIHHWRNLLQARAIENQCYTIGVNRVGIDAYETPYNGQSGVVSFDGTWIDRSGDQPGFHWANLDYPSMAAYRTEFAFLEDRDSFTIQ